MKKRVYPLALFLLILLASCASNTTTVTSTPIATNTVIQAVSKTSLVTSAPVRVTPVLTATLSATITPTTFSTQVSTPTPVVPNRLPGIILDPDLPDDPEQSIDIQELEKMIRRIAPYTESIRTLQCGQGMDKAAPIAQYYGLKIAVGAKLGKDKQANQKELDCLLALNQGAYIDLAVIGDEAITKGDLTEDELVTYITQFREHLAHYVLITSAENWKNIRNYTKLISAVDMVGMNVYPDQTLIPPAALKEIEKWYLDFNHFLYTVDPTKDDIITATRWPSCGRTNTLGHETFYLGAFSMMSKAYTLPFFWYEAYDGKSTPDDPMSQCGGIWDAKGDLKKGMDYVFYPQPGQQVPMPDVTLDYFANSVKTDTLRGVVSDVDPQNYAVVVYILVPDSTGQNKWWIKPSYERPLTLLDDKGLWECQIETGGNDRQLIKIAVFLVSIDYSPPLLDGWVKLPEELYNHSVIYPTFIDR